MEIYDFWLGYEIETIIMYIIAINTQYIYIYIFYDKMDKECFCSKSFKL